MTGLPIEFLDDGSPVSKRKDYIPHGVSFDHDKDITLYENMTLPEHRELQPRIQVNLIVMDKSTEGIARQAWLGLSHQDEKTGHKFGRVIQALDNCRIILQRWSEPGKVNDLVILSMRPLYYAIVPPTYETVLINTSSGNPARFIELRARREDRNTNTLTNLKGSGYILDQEGNITSNTNYDELPIPRIQPGLSEFKFLGRRSVYEIFIEYPNKFDFIDPPREEFFVGAI